MTIANDGRLTPPEKPDPCCVCGGPVSYPANEYRDVHDDCRGELDTEEDNHD